MSRTTPLIAPRARSLVLGIVGACAAGALALGVRHHDSTGPGRLDAIIDPALTVDSSSVRQVLWLLVLLGDPTIMVALAVGLALCAVRTRGWPAAALAIVGPFTSAALTEFVLKPGFGRTRFGDLAYPSGHTVTSVAVATVFVLLATGAGSRRYPTIRRPAVTVVAAAPVGVAVSLVALELHYVTDTIGGACVSVAVVLTTALALDVLAGAWRPGVSSPSRAARKRRRGGGRRGRGLPAAP